MGILHPAQVKEQTKMIKAILIACLATVAFAEAEADPYYLGGYGLGYHGIGYTGLGYRGLGYAGLGYHDSDIECTARGRPSLRLLLILTTDTDILVSDTPDTVTDTVSDTPDTVTDTTVTDTVTDTTDGDVKATADKLHQ